MQQLSNPRLTKNNFDLLRFLFAGTVCLVHAYELSGYQQLEWITGVLSSAVAVKSFFVVSGFWIFMSFERSSSISSYASKRARRIYPAYVAVVMLCALGLVTVSSSNPGDYFSLAWIKYVVSNLIFLNFAGHTLPGVFEANKIAAVNGALWTLKIEVMFYLAVPLLVLWFRRFGQLSTIIATYCASIAYACLFALAAERTGSGIYLELARQLPGQLSFFMAGAFFFYYLKFFEQHVGFFLPGAIAVLSVNMIWPLPLLEPFALATVVVFCGLFLYAGNFGKYGDFSYGVYIVHFPIIQLLLNWGGFGNHPWLFLVAVILITASTAIVIWHLIEKRFLQRNSHYVVATFRSYEEPLGNKLNTDAPNRRVG